MSENIKILNKYERRNLYTTLKNNIDDYALWMQVKQLFLSYGFLNQKLKKQSLLIKHLETERTPQ